MPYIYQKRRLGPYLKQVFIAPFALVCAAIYIKRYILLMFLICVIICLSLNVFRLKDLIPEKEKIFIFLGCLGFIALVSIPLALRDFFVSDPIESVLVQDEQCINRAMEFCQYLFVRNYEKVFSLLHPTIRNQSKYLADLSEYFKKNSTSDQYPDSVTSIKEISSTQKANPSEKKELGVVSPYASIEAVLSSSNKSFQPKKSPFSKLVFELFREQDNVYYVMNFKFLPLS